MGPRPRNARGAWGKSASGAHRLTIFTRIGRDGHAIGYVADHESQPSFFGVGIDLVCSEPSPCLVIFSWNCALTSDD